MKITNASVLTGNLAGLIPDRLNNCGMAVADAGHRGATGCIDELLPVRECDIGALGGLCHRRRPWCAMQNGGRLERLLHNGGGALHVDSGRHLGCNRRLVLVCDFCSDSSVCQRASW